MFSCARATNEMNYVAQKFARRGHGHQQRRLLQPHLSRAQRRGPVGRVRLGRRHLVVRGGRAHRPHRDVGLQRPLRAPDLLPPRAEGDQERRPDVRGRPAPHLHRRVGGELARARTSAPTSRWPTPIGREIIHAGLANDAFVERATDRLRGVRRRGRAVDPRRSPRRSPASRPRPSGSSRTPTPRAERAQLCWTLGITEHHNATDNVRALINLSLLTGHVGPLRLGPAARCAGRTTCRAAATWAPSPTGCPASRTSSTRTPARSSSRRGAPRSSRATACTSPRCSRRWTTGTLTRGLLHRREPGPVRGRHASHAVQRLQRARPSGGAGHLPDKTAELADVVLPATAAWCETRGHGDQQRAPGAAGPQGARPARPGPRRHRHHLRPGPAPRATTGTFASAEEIWDELRSLAPIYAGMSYAGWRSSRASSGRAPRTDRLEPPYLHGGCGRRTRPGAARPRRSGSSSTGCRWTSSTRTTRYG